MMSNAGRRGFTIRMGNEFWQKTGGRLMEPLEVVHTPNPCDQHRSDSFEKDPFLFMWYYRTEVRNNTDRPLRVVKFEGYMKVFGRWVPNNIKRRELTNEDFRQWYGDENGQPSPGAIPPGGKAVCAVNWWGGNSPVPQRTKWVYHA